MFWYVTRGRFEHFGINYFFQFNEVIAYSLQVFYSCLVSHLNNVQDNLSKIKLLRTLYKQLTMLFLTILRMFGRALLNNFIQNQPKIVFTLEHLILTTLNYSNNYRYIA